MALRKINKTDELQLVKKELREAYKLNHELISSITSILIGIGRDNTVSMWNTVAEKSLGISAERVLRKSLHECPIPWESERIIDAIVLCRMKKQPLRLDDVRFTYPDGQEGFLGFTLIPLQATSKNLSGFLLLFGADITARKKAEAELRLKTQQLSEANIRIEKEKAQFEVLLESIGDGMVATDQHGKIIMMNAHAQELLGWTNRTGVGQSFHELIPAEDDNEQPLLFDQTPMAMSLATGRKIFTKAYYICKDGKKLPVAVTVSPVVVNDQVMGAVQIFRDITNEKELDRMKTEFIATVSHELRTPLTGIREGIAQVLEGILGTVNEEQKDFLNLSLTELDRLTSIVNDLLDISKIEAGKVELRKEWFDLGALIDKLSAEYSGLMKNKKLAIKKDLQETDVRLYADYEKITQVLINLISNAYKFTEPGGEIRLSARKIRNGVQIVVEDTGIGIEAENLDKIFERFVSIESAKRPGIKGTGLGLPICKSLVEMHKGQIWAESEIGIGSRFTIILPNITEDLLSDVPLDKLTRLYNRSGFFMLSEQQFKLAQRTSQRLVLFVVDYLNLKEIHETHGPLEAEQSLIQFAEILRTTFKRETDIVARIGDDQFVVLVLQMGEDTPESLKRHLEQEIHKACAGEPNEQKKMNVQILHAQFDGKTPKTFQELFLRAGKIHGSNHA